MLRLKEKFTQSYQELHSVRSLTGVAMLLSVSIILSYVLRIDITPSLRLGFSFVASAAIGMLYGPVVGGMAVGLGDVIKYLLKPVGAFQPSLTLITAFSGVIYGVFLYKGKPTLKGIIASKAIINLFCNGVLNTIALSNLYGKGFQALFLPRLTKNLIMLPIEVIVLSVTLPVIAAAFTRAMRGVRQ